MKRFCHFFSLMIIFFTVYSQNYQVLFIGNSYTYSNDLPGTLHNLALSSGDTILYDSYAPGGYTFQSHSADANALAKINSKAWDFVILQEQSQLPSFPDNQLVTDVFPYAHKLDSIIHKNNKCSRTVFFMTWGRKYGDASNCASWPPVCSFEGMNDRLRYAYLKMADTNRAVAAPVGVAWRMSRSQDSTINLWSADNSHPSVAGTYLSACVFYATLWHKDPRALSYAGSLGAPVAEFLRNIAYHVVFDSLVTWNIGEFDPWAAYDYTADNGSVQFNNLSLGAEEYSWDFGDGETSTEENPLHEYVSGGSYSVCLQASDSCVTRSYCRNIGVISGVPESESVNAVIYPNPCDDYINVRYTGVKGGFSVRVTDVSGRVVRTCHDFTDGNCIIGLEGVESGLYRVEIYDGMSVRVQKLIISK